MNLNLNELYFEYKEAVMNAIQSYETYQSLTFTGLSQILCKH